MPQRRRSRFTVQLSTGPSVVLAYDAQGARSYYVGRGREVLSVVKGDYRIAPSVGGWTLDQDAVNAAAASLGLKLPVTIKANARQGSTLGNHRLKPQAGLRAGPAQRASGYHAIMVKSYLTPEQASSTLWHELTHSLQAERAGGTPELWRVEQRKHHGQYRHSALEIEARAMSVAMADCPLTK